MSLRGFIPDDGSHPEDYLPKGEQTPGRSGGLPWFSGRPSPTYPIGQQSAPPTAPPEPTPPKPTGGPPPEVAGVFAGLTARDWIALAAAVAGITGAVRSNNPNLTPNTLTDDPQLKELLGLMKGRLQKSEPLHDSILSMANGLLPTQYQRDNPLLRGGT